MMRRRHSEKSVGALLRALPVPEHSDGFFDRLGEQLRAEDGDRDESPSAVIDLSVRRTAPPAPARGFKRAMRGAAAPAAAAAACFALVVGGALYARTAVEERREDEVAARLVTVQPDKPAKTGLRVRFRMFDPRRGADAEHTFTAVIGANGDYHVARVHPVHVANYDASTGTKTVYQEVGGVSAVVTQTGQPDAPPDGPDSTSATGALSRDLGAAVRAIAVERPDQVARVQWRGRPALEHRDTGSGSPIFYRQHLIVDEATGIPVTIEQRRADGSLYRRMDVDELVEGPIDAAALAPPLPAAATAYSERRNFQSTTLEDAAGMLPYKLVAPGWVPEKYRLSRVAVAPAVANKEGQVNPSYADTVSLVYRDGLDSFSISMRRAAPWAGPVTWSDPVLQGTPFADTSQIERIAEGALAGIDAYVSISPVLWPHVWAQHGDVVVTIAGDLSRAELLQVTRSLESYTP